MKKLLILLFLIASSPFAHAQEYDFAQRFNSKSVPPDVHHYTLLVFSPVAEDNSFTFTDILRSYKGSYEAADIKSFTEGKYKDINKYKYAVVLTRSGIEPNASYSIYITETANRSHIQSANLYSKDWEKMLRFYVNKLNGY